MAERAQISRPEPALASQVLKCFPCHDVSHRVAGVRARGRSAWVGDGQQARGGQLSISGWRSLAVHALDLACGHHGPEDRPEGVASPDHKALLEVPVALDGLALRGTWAARLSLVASASRHPSGTTSTSREGYAAG